MSSQMVTIPKEPKKFTGYVANPTRAGEDKISRPSLNCMVTKNGSVQSRFGVLNTAWDLNLGNNAVKPFYHETYDVSIFFGGGKVVYVDHNNSDAIVDTGSTLTAGTTTRPEEYLGDLYYTNTTDGCKKGMFGRLNDATADSGDGTVIVDLDLAARLIAFGKTTGDIVLGGDSYAFNNVNINGTVTLNAVTLSQDYSDNTVVYIEHDTSASLEKFSKVTFWTERMMGIGYSSVTNADQPNNTVLCSKFVIGQVGGSGIEDIIDFTYGTGGATKVTIGKGGKLTNIVPIKDYIGFLKEHQNYAAHKDNIDSTGSNIGLTIPELKNESHGCLNEDCAIAIGGNEVTSITSDHRIVRDKLDIADELERHLYSESYDNDIIDDLQEMDEEQPLAMAYYYKGGKQRIYQLSRNGQWYWYIYDESINVDEMGIARGGWQAPQLVVPANGFFERKGVLYATDATNDTIYSVFTNFDDNTVPIECTIASPEYKLGSAMVRKSTQNGTITQGTDMEMKAYVTNKKAGTRESSPKIVEGSNYTYGANRSIGAVAVGGSSNAVRMPDADWNEDFDIYPQEANKVQLRYYCYGDFFSLDMYQMLVEIFDRSFSKTL